MGWNARMETGEIYRQSDGVRFHDIHLHKIRELWLDGLENFTFNRNKCPGFIEFIQFNSAVAEINGVRQTGEFIGWTDGHTEYVFGVSSEQHIYHPHSRCNRTRI